MKKSLFERIVYDMPGWILSTLVYGIGGSVLLLLMFGLPGCTIYEPLPGLCYTDKEGTYLCPEGNNTMVKKTRATDLTWVEARDFARDKCQMFIGQEEYMLCYDLFMLDEYARLRSGG